MNEETEKSQPKQKSALFKEKVNIKHELNLNTKLIEHCLDDDNRPCEITKRSSLISILDVHDVRECDSNQAEYVIQMRI